MKSVMFSLVAVRLILPTGQSGYKTTFIQDHAGNRPRNSRTCLRDNDCVRTCKMRRSLNKFQ